MAMHMRSDVFSSLSQLAHEDLHVRCQHKRPCRQVGRKAAHPSSIRRRASAADKVRAVVVEAWACTLLGYHGLPTGPCTGLRALGVGPSKPGNIELAAAQTWRGSSKASGGHDQIGTEDAKKKCVLYSTIMTHLEIISKPETRSLPNSACSMQLVSNHGSLAVWQTGQVVTGTPTTSTATGMLSVPAVVLVQG